jgi:hypothetical protein
MSCSEEEVQRYELARDLLDSMISTCCHESHLEKKKENPDFQKIQLISQVRQRFSLEENNLSIDDYQKIDQIINEYGPISKAHYLDMKPNTSGWEKFIASVNKITNAP